MALYHFSKKPIKKLVQRHMYKFDEEQYRRQRIPGKPFGFWVSLGDSWKEWCVDQEFRLECLKYKYEVTLKPDANILNIVNIEQFDAFGEEYGFCRFPEIEEDRKERWKDYPDYVKSRWGRKYIDEIRWIDLKSKHQGIVVSNIGRDMMNVSRMWHSGWDCCSGVIWDTKCVEKLTLVEDG